jgi:hypothetical protein
MSRSASSFRFEGSSRTGRATTTCHQGGSSSRGVGVAFSVIFDGTSGRMGSPLPLRPSPHRLAHGVFVPSGARGLCNPRAKTLVALRSPPESDRPDAAASGRDPLATASLAVCSPSASSQRRAATHPGGTSSGFCCPLSVSHALEALLRPPPAGLVSCRSRPWGFPLQGRSHPQSEPPSRTPLPSCGCAASQIPPTPPRCRQAVWGRPTPLRGGCWPKGPSHPALHFRALLPASVRTRQRRIRPTAEPRPSWGSSSLGGSPSPSEALPEPVPSRASQRPRKLEPLVHHRVSPTKRLAGLPRACHPFRGFSTSSTPSALHGKASKSLHKTPERCKQPSKARQNAPSVAGAH